MIQMRIQNGKLQGSWGMGALGIDVYNWWMEYDVLPGQVDILEDETVWRE